MAQKVCKIILNVDLGCPRCYKKIKEVLCKYREIYQIKEEIFDEKNNTVTISGSFCPSKLSKKLCCKAGNVIKCHKIVEKEPPRDDKTGKLPQKGKTGEPPKEDKTVKPPKDDETGKLPKKGQTGKPPKEDETGKLHKRAETEKPQAPPGREADWQLVQQIVVHCGPSGYVPHPPCHCGCGISQQPCHDGCGGPSGCVPPPPCHCGCGRPQQPCHGGCGGTPASCYCRCERPCYRSPCTSFCEEDPNACVVM